MNYKEKYPWLRGINLYDGNVEDGDSILEDFPAGWFNTFGELMLDELDTAVKKAHLEDDFRILQIKEKFGSLRFYVSNFTDEIASIISKYETLSNNICIECGKPDTFFLGNLSWVLPMCEDCFKKNHPNTTHQLYLSYATDNGKMDEEMVVHRFQNGEWTDVTIPIGPTAKKIREKWAEKPGL